MTPPGRIHISAKIAEKEEEEKEKEDMGIR